MATGACGIDCTVCGLHVSGQCSSCGGGASDTASEKLGAQYKLFGMACSILECAVGRKLDYCSRDCEDFPCSLYKKGPYPYAEGYLTMQERRRKKTCGMHHTDWPEVADGFWDELKDLDKAQVCRNAQVAALDRGGFNVKCLNENWLVNLGKKSVKKGYGHAAGEWDRHMPYLILAYLIRAGEEQPEGRMVSPREVVPGLNYFQGNHSIITNEIEEHFAQDAESFQQTGLALGGEATEQGDASFRLLMFPKFPVEYILWIADEELPAKLTVLLDAKSRLLYPVNVTYQAVNLLSRRLIFSSKEFDK